MSQERKAPVCLIDASIYIFQYYFALPPNWTASNGYTTEAVYGFATFLLKLRETHRPKRVAACFDESLGSSFREALYPDYKSSRAMADDALAFQLKACKDFAQLLGIPCFGSNTYEADDLLGSLVAVMKRSPQAVAVLSRDKDLGQLIRRPQDFLWDYAKQASLYPPDIKEKWGIGPELVADYLALVGDPIDDIPGVPGIGAKTAALLLSHYPGIESLYANLAELDALPVRGAKNLAAKLEVHIETVAMAKTLATIVCDIPLIDSVNDLEWGAADIPALESFCHEMGFPRLFPRIEKVMKGRA